MANYFVADMGGTSVKYGLATQAGALSHTGKFKTPSTLEAFLEGLLAAYLSLKDICEIKGIAISSPGAIDAQKGVVHGTSAIPYIHEISFTKLISQRLKDLPVSIENDANCAALGELWQGEAKGMHSIAAVVCGSGIGGGVIVDQKIVRGPHFLGGEFGYMPMLARDGSLKTWSDFTIVNLTKCYEAQTGEQIDGYTLASRCRAGEKIAQTLMEDFFLHCAMGMVTIQYCYDPEIIVLGGALSKDEWIIDGIRKKIREIAKGQDFDIYHPDVRPCLHGNNANLLGALYHFLNMHC